VWIVGDEAALHPRTTSAAGAKRPLTPIMGGAGSGLLAAIQNSPLAAAAPARPRQSTRALQRDGQNEAECQEHPLPDAGRLASPDCGMRPHASFHRMAGNYR
tara:strand:+ start:11699 stop:12004 length:306 start_codon:yes stop_codon:yes gene_type:complete